MQISKQLLDLTFFFFNIILHITQPTRQKSCTDHLISNIRTAKGEILHLGISDHETAQLLTIPATNKKTMLTNYIIYKRYFSNENILKFRECMRGLSFNDVYNESNLELAYSNFHELLTLFFNLCFPILKREYFL